MTRRTPLLLLLASAALLAAWLTITIRDKPAAPSPTVVVVKEAAPQTEQPPAGLHSFRQAARKAMPSVVNVYSLKQVAGRRGPYKQVADSVELVNRIAAIKPGDTTQATVTRDGRELRFEYTRRQEAAATTVGEVKSSRLVRR